MKYPLYIPSKGRWESRLTVKALDRIGVDYHVIVEEQEYRHYASVIECDRLLVLDPAYQRDYDACMDLLPHQSRGSGPARNFAWDHAISEYGAERHWIVDDNIRHFVRLNKNKKVNVADGQCFTAMEDFTDRYENIAISGPDYRFFAANSAPLDPFVLNKRVFSCILIRNDIPFRWRARYNEDLDLCLRVLKAGYCSVLFKAFLQDKMPTQSMKGGNTDEVYREGTRAKSEMIVRLHPDCCRLADRYGRDHHHADFSQFTQRLQRKQEALV
jgi:hypothetical protein